MADAFAKPSVSQFGRKPADTGPERGINPQSHLKIISALSRALDVPPIDKLSLSDSCDDLFSRIQTTKARLRDAEALIGKRDDQLKELAQKAREEIHAAAERVLRAEIRVSEAEAQGKLEAAEWQKRALAAEEKVNEMEGWLAKMRGEIVADMA